MGSFRSNGSTRRWRKIGNNVLIRDQHRFRYCGAMANTVDHITPRRAGGTDSLSNLVASCRSCNGKKGGQIRSSLDREHSASTTPDR